MLEVITSNDFIGQSRLFSFRYNESNVQFLLGGESLRRLNLTRRDIYACNVCPLFSEWQSQRTGPHPNVQNILSF
jgi:hypothetical protein